MKTDPIVTVIIPTYNSAHFIADAIESVLSQSYKNIETIVVNDGSTDNTDDVVMQYGSKLTYIKQDNTGPAAARNNGIRAAKGEIIAFLDADDIWSSSKVQKQINKMESAENAAMVYTQIENFVDGTGEIRNIEPMETPEGYIFNEILVKNFIPLPTVLVRKDILFEVGCFDERLFTAEDTNLWLKIARKYPVVAIKEALVRRRMHRDNISQRLDINVGTIMNLDNIVSVYPDVNPMIYSPMHEAYLIRGTDLIVSLFNASEYRRCRDVCIKLLHNGIRSKQIIAYNIVTLLPHSIIALFRKSVRATRCIWKNCR